MWAIDRVHRRYISPTMLEMAVEHALRRRHVVEDSTALAFLSADSGILGCRFKRDCA